MALRPRWDVCLLCIYPLACSACVRVGGALLYGLAPRRSASHERIYLLQYEECMVCERGAFAASVILVGSRTCARLHLGWADITPVLVKSILTLPHYEGLLSL